MASRIENGTCSCHESIERGFTVLFRAYALIVLALACTGCAGGSLGPPLALETGSLRTASPADGSADAAGGQTMAAKVLAALALERSTGRAPDPARLDDLN